MSAAAPSNFQAIIGNTARALSSLSPAGRPEGDGEHSRRTRTPLTLVVITPSKRRAPFAVFCFLTLVAALVVVLVLNISVSSGQYELVQLRNHQADLLKSNQDLTQQVQNAEAPQNLVSRATELGMVTSSSMGQIDLGSMAVSGNPKPATSPDKPLAVIAAPAVNGVQPTQGTPDVPAAAPSPDAASTGGSAATSDALVPGQRVGTAAGTAGGPAPATTPAPAPAPAAQAPAAPAQDLHGGTIPVPRQKNG